MQVLSGDPKNLTFANYLHGFDSSDQHGCSCRRMRTPHRAEALPHVPVIGFNAIIREPSRAMSAARSEVTFLLQVSNTCWITAQSVSRENVWCAVIRISQRSFEEALRDLLILSFR
jgi:hypothetical protein